MHFLPGSLSSWADKLDKTDFKFLKDGDLRKKQVFPYDFFTINFKDDITEKLALRGLPPINFFKNQKEYEWAQYTFASKKCANLNDYMLMYLVVDVLLLAEVFEKFIDTSLIRYQLDPSWYYTTPGYSWDCAFYKTNESIELLMDPEMVEFFLSDAIRGGISSVLAKKHLVANNEYIPNFDPSKPKNYIMYLDITNLYGYAMVQKLPYSKFEFMNGEFCEAAFNDISTLFKCSGGEDSWGYILEVDLDYPSHLHEKHNNLPLAPHHFNERLCATLLPKKKYTFFIKSQLQNSLLALEILLAKWLGS